MTSHLLLFGQQSNTGPGSSDTPALFIRTFQNTFVSFHLKRLQPRDLMSTAVTALDPERASHQRFRGGWGALAFGDRTEGPLDSVRRFSKT